MNKLGFTTGDEASSPATHDWPKLSIFHVFECTNDSSGWFYYIEDEIRIIRRFTELRIASTSLAPLQRHKKRDDMGVTQKYKS